MKLCFHCPHGTVPLGRRLAKKAAERAGFDGTLHIVCYGRDKPTKQDIGTKGQLMGSFHPNHGIRLYNFGPHAQGFKWVPSEEDQFRTFCHELGHFRRHLKGLPQGMDTPHEAQAERYANRYANQEFKELCK